jgi:hypothetical protein
MDRHMQSKSESRLSPRINRESIIMVGYDVGLSPYFAVSTNSSRRGMHFKSLFKLQEGVQIFIRIDNYTTGQHQVPARVVWCKQLENSRSFRYGIGVEFLSSSKKNVTNSSKQVESQPISSDCEKELDSESNLPL